MPQSFNISGPWGGRYWYNDFIEEPVPFSAWLSVVDGALTGTTLEPNTFLFNGPEELDAELQGGVHGALVQFDKVYPGVEQPAVWYDGLLSEAGNRIFGSWVFRKPGELSGRFEMTRIMTKTRATAGASARAR
ncbi:MAG: hypothetical protein AAFZ91_14695 [Pseudomonadota bacterium]